MNAYKTFPSHYLYSLHNEAFMQQLQCLAQGHGGRLWNGEWLSFICSAAFQWKPHSVHLTATTGPDIYLSAGCHQLNTQNTQSNTATEHVYKPDLAPSSCLPYGWFLPAVQTLQAKHSMLVCGSPIVCERVTEPANKTEANQSKRKSRTISIRMYCCSGGKITSAVIKC